ncbi:MAG TPA: TatD family hydrolase [Magnetospirillaceae bacterium]|nr:TatD family hydrolase [Magnetospirillaceae bacterium]
MTEAYTDTHAHLSLIHDRCGARVLAAVCAAYDAVWAAAGTAGCLGSAPIVVDPGTRADDLPGRLLLAGRRPWLRYAAGVWPGKEALGDPGPHIEALKAAASLPDCSAIGEAGLDYNWMHGSREAQRRLFEAQIELAVSLKKPLIVHSRDAHGDTAAILRNARPDIRVVIHCFGYDAVAAGDYLEIGCFISFAGNLTYPAAQALRKACAAVPTDRLLLETDSPYMAPVPVRGKPSTPLLVGHVHDVAAKMHGMDIGQIALAVTVNARRVFN